MKNSDIRINCFCGASGSSIYIDTKNGEIVCGDCGLVLDEYFYWNDEIYEC